MVTINKIEDYEPVPGGAIILWVTRPRSMLLLDWVQIISRNSMKVDDL
jgi:hypothetical protein